jgi:hypothetical protein
LGGVIVESEEVGGVVAQEILDGFDGTIADAQPDEFGRAAVKETAKVKIGIFGDDGESILPGMIPNDGVVGVTQTDLAHVRAAGERIGKELGQSEARGFGRRAVSCRQRSQLAFTVGGKGQAGADIFLGEIGKFGEDLGVTHTRSQIFEDIGDGHAGAADAGFAAAFAGFKGNEVMVIHRLKTIRNPAGVKAQGATKKQDLTTDGADF